jgi:hypothetical protein
VLKSEGARGSSLRAVVAVYLAIAFVLSFYAPPTAVLPFYALDAVTVTRYSHRDRYA